ncbi:hypothetical protein ACFUJ2_15005, partial [Streptomyces coelicoflavus]
MVFALTGERFIDADEDLAYDDRLSYSGLGRKLERILALITESIHAIAEAMPENVAKSYSDAMGLLTNDKGKNLLMEFAGQLDAIAEGRIKSSMDIIKSKWEIIAEVVRLLIELAVLMVLAYFTGGASASQIFLAKLRSRFAILASLLHLLQRLHLTPTLGEAIAEAFTDFAVQLAMMYFGPDGRRPKGIDWGDILKAFAFGAAAGAFTSIFNDIAKQIVKGYDKNVFKDGLDLDFKNNPDLPKRWSPGPPDNSPKTTPDPKPDPTPDPPKNHPDPKPDPTPDPPKNHPDPKPDPTPDPPKNHPDPKPEPTPGPPGNSPNPAPDPPKKPPVTSRDHPFSFRNNPELWRNNPYLRGFHHRPGAVAGHYGLKATTDFVASGAGEGLGEYVVKGGFYGEWSWSWDTFAGAGLSSQVETTLSDTTQNISGEVRHAVDNLRNRPPTVSGGTGAPPTLEGSSDGRSPTSTGDNDGAPSTPPPSLFPTSPVPDTTGTPPSHTQGSDPAPPQSHPKGSDPAPSAENELWQQVHKGSPEIREQALRDLAGVRGSQPPTSTETGIRDGLYNTLSQVPEIRVVPTGNSAAVQIDTEEVSRILDGFGSPVTVEPLPSTVPHTVGSGTGTTVDSPAGPPTTPPPATSAPITSDGPGTSTAPDTSHQTHDRPHPQSTPTPEDEPQDTTTPDNPPHTQDAPPNALEPETTAPTDNRSTPTPPVTTDSPNSPAPHIGDTSGTPNTPNSQTQPQSTPTPEDKPQDTTTPNNPPHTQDAPPNAPEPETTAPTDNRNTPTPPVTDADDTSDVTTGRPVPENAAPAQASPLTILVSEGPPPAEGSPEAAQLLDTAGTDRAVVLGPASAPDGAGRPARSSVELTREGPDAPVRVRPLTGPPVATPDSTGSPASPAGGQNSESPMDTANTVFPGADVLLPLADALGTAPAPAPRPVTQSKGVTPESLSPPPPLSDEREAFELSTLAGPARGPGGSLDGIDARGEYYQFDYRDVRAKSMRDYDDNLIGISFPTTPRDIEQVTDWARQRYRTSDTEAYSITQYGDPQSPDYRMEFARPAPWNNRPLYIHAHASNEFFDIPVDMGDGTVRKLRVDGTTFGRIVRHHPGYRQATQLAPNQDGLLMSCISGHPEATAAADFARYMHDRGSTRTWFAPTGWGVRIRRIPGTTNSSGYGSTQTLDAHGNTVPGWFTRFDPPSQQMPSSHLSHYAGPTSNAGPYYPSQGYSNPHNPSQGYSNTYNPSHGYSNTYGSSHGYSSTQNPNSNYLTPYDSYPSAESATDLYLQSGHGGEGGPGAGTGLGPGGTPTPPPPPPPMPMPMPMPPADPPTASSPQGRIIVRPAQHDQTGTGGNGSTAPTGNPVVVTTDGRTVPVAQLRFWVNESTKPQPGHPIQRLSISHSPAEDRTAGGAARRELLGQDTFRSVRTTPDSPRPRVVFTGARSPLPGSGTESGADYFVGHGTPRTVTFGSHDHAYPTVTVNGVQAGEVFKLFGGDGPLVLYSCKTGRQPEVAGLPVAQHVANRTGRPVWAPTTEPGTVRDKHGNVQAVLVEGPDGPGEWRLFTPEPSGPDLDRLARDIGLHSGPEPVDAFAQARTLQQVRTLREILGPDAEQRPENRDLLAGLAFVDGLRWLAPDTAARYGDGRMTPDLLRRMVAGRHAATGGTAADPGADPTVEQYTEFLRDAAGLRGTAESDSARDNLLPPPPPVLPPTTLVAPEDVQGLGYAPSARITWSLSSTPLPLSELTLSPGDLTELARRRPDLVPVADGTGSVVEDPRDTDGVTTPSNPPVVVHANGTAYMRLTTPGDGNCLFRALLDSARGQDIPPAWASRNVAGLRDLLADRLTGSELAAAAAEATPDPVLAVVDDLRMDALAGVVDPAGRQRITEHWNEIAQAVVTDGDPREWQRILVESGYPHLAALAPTPADARRIGTEQLIVTATRLPELWASPFSDLLPQALAHTLDLDLRLVQPDPQSPGSTLVTSLHPGGRGGTLHLDYNGTDHYSALVPFPPVRTSAAASPGESDPFGQWLHDMGGIPDLFGPDPQETLRQWLHDMATTPDLYGPDPQETLRQWLHDMAGVTDLPAPATQRPGPFTQWLQDLGGTPDLFGPDPDEQVPLETRLERNRPAQLLTGPDVSPPRPAPHTVTFADGSALPSVLISPQSGPRDGDPDGTQSPPTGLLTGPGVLTLRSPGQVAQQILGQLPSKLRSQFDEAELLRLLTEQPSAFTAPRGALLVGREKSGVGHEMRVEAIPYHHWKRLSDADGSTVKLDTTRRGQAGTGVGSSIGTGRRIAGALGLGPPLNWILKVSASLGWTRRTDYALGTQTYHQSESREPDGSHLHLDDVYYQVRVDRVVLPRHRLTKRPGTVGQDPPPAGPPQSGPVTDRNNPVPGRPDSPPPPEPRWQRSQVHSAAFAVRDGLTWRLPDALTVPFKGPRRAPKTLTFPDGREPRVSDTTGLHLVDPPEDLVLALSGARPGSSAHRRLVSFVQPAQLLPLFGRFAGPVSGPEVTRGSRQRPLGHLVVERSIPHRATLVTESIGTEVRELTQTTYQNQRGHVRDTRFGIQVSSGPNGTVVGPETDIRIQGGPVVRADLGTGRSHGLGNDAARKTTAQVRERPVALYQVERTLMVRKAGEPASKARPVRVVTLDWMSTQDARRLAGWDSRTPGQSGPNPDAEPPVPWYLTPEDPVHLGGQVRAEGFRPDRPRQDAAGQPIPEDPQSPRTPQHPLRVFADSVLETLHQSYPSMFLSPWALKHPRLAGLWYGDGRIRTALHNERQVREALNRPTLAQSLDDLTTTGVPVSLTEDGTVRRGHHVLVLRARLTDRRFETTLSERAMRNAVIGTEVSGQGQQADTTLSAGIEVGVSPRTHGKVAEPAFRENTGNVAVGGRYAHTTQKATRSAVAVTHDHLSFQESSDLYSYRVELDATFEGHRRPRGWARLVSVGLLGTGYFVSKVAERPLFHGDSQAVGRVELAVPAAHGSARHGPVDGPPRAPAPAPEQLSSADADHLLDGTRRPTAEGSADRELAHHLLSAPHVVLGVEGSGQRRQLMQDTADRATGDSWHVNAPGARAGTALRRAVANLGVAAQLGQYLGPFGSRVSGLVGAGPFRTHHLKGAVRGELHNLRVKSDPRRSGLEATLGTEHRLVGGASSGSRVTVGVQGADRPLQQPPGQPVAAGSYTAGLQYSHGRTSQVTQTLTPGRNTALKFTGRMYLVVADVMETIAVRDRWTAAFGAVGTRAGNAISSAAGRFSRRLADGLAPRRAAAAVQQIRDAVMFHLPMQDVIGAGLAPDGLGTATPRNLGGGYRMPSFLGGRPLPAHPSGQLDASAVARELLPRLEGIGVPSHDREQILQRLSPDFLRANRQELTTDGMPLPIRYRSWSSPHHLPVGGSPGQVRIRLIPVTTTVERLRTGFEFEDIRATARDDAQGEAQQSGAELSLGMGARTQDGVLAANPSLQGTAAGQRSSTSGQTTGHASLPSMATTQTHAETVTSYRLTVTTTDVSGEEIVPPVTAPVGSLNEFVPTSLLTPVGDGDDGTLTEQAVPEPERAVRMLPAPQARPEGVAAWRTSSDSGTTDRGPGADGGADPDILPFDDRIGSGIVAVDVIGAANVGDALTLATARADEFVGNDLGKRHTGGVLTERLRMARFTPLTGLGTAAAQLQQEATGQTGLTSNFRQALGANGSALPVQASADLLGQFHTADSRLYAKMHRHGARLLAVEHKPKMDGSQRSKTSDAHEAGIADNVEGTVGTGPLVSTSGAGMVTPSTTVPIAGTNDGIGQKGTVDTTLADHVKVAPARSMLFALPVSWLAVAEVDHRITDNKMLHALGKPVRGPRAAEAETTALVWLREDIARDYGLLDDATFPDEVGEAWDDAAKAAGDLTAAEQGYYEARARARETWLGLSPEEQAALGEDGSGRTNLPTAMAKSPAVVSWQAAHGEVRRWELRTDAAASEHHRLHLHASRVTAHHQNRDSVPAPGPSRKHSAPAWRSEAPAPYRITGGGDSGPRALISPDGATVREVHDVPHDGASFFHALLAAAEARGRLPHLLGTDLADRLMNTHGDPEVVAEAVGAARDRLAWALGADGNEDLLDALALDVSDTFGQDELDAAGVELTPAQQAEFDAFGRLPETFWPNPAQRVALATAALSRPFASEPREDGAARPDGEPAPPERRAGDHGGADLLPALAARVLGTPLTVVTGEGLAQLFLPHGGDPAAVDPTADPVLFTADGFFHAALPPGTPAPVIAHAPADTARDTRTGATDTSPPTLPVPSQGPQDRDSTSLPSPGDPLALSGDEPALGLSTLTGAGPTTGPTVRGLTIEPGDAVLKIPSYETGILEGALTQEYGTLPDPADLKPGGKLIIIGHGHQLGDGQKAATEIQDLYNNTLPAGTHIHMIVCQAGSGAYPPAQRLADTLDIPVVASTIDVTMNNIFDDEHYMDVEHDDPYAQGLHRGLNTTHTTLHGNFYPYTPQTTTTNENTNTTPTTGPTVKGLTIEPGDAVLKIPSYETGILEGALTQEYGTLPDPADLKPGGKLI